MTLLWRDGQRAPGISGDRGWQYGDGVFRTLLLFDGALQDRDGQLDRLARDAARLSLHMPERLSQDLDLVVGGIERAVVKIVLSRDGQGQRGYAPMSSSVHTFIAVDELPLSWDTANQGLNVGLSDVQLAIQPLFAGVKHLNRLEQVWASRNWPPTQQEAIMTDAHGHLICGTHNNVFLIKNNQIITPDLSGCGVAGRMRERVLAYARHHGISCTIKSVPLTAAATVDAMFVTNSVRGIQAVRQFQQLTLQNRHPLIQQLRTALDHPAHRDIEQARQ